MLCISRSVVASVLAKTTTVRSLSSASSSLREPSSEATFPRVRMQTKLFINNEFVDSVTGKSFETYNPGDGSLLATVAQATKEDVDIAVNGN